MNKLIKERIDENIGEWELTEVTAAGTVTRNHKSILGDDIIYHKDDVLEEAEGNFKRGEDPYDKLNIGNVRDEDGNIKRRDGFTQVCVWPGTMVGDSISKFEEFILDELDTRTQYLENILTNAGQGGDGGRDDLFFAIHNEDVSKFAVPRLQYGIRWIEDFLDNGADEIHDKRIKKYRNW